MKRSIHYLAAAAVLFSLVSCMDKPEKTAKGEAAQPTITDAQRKLYVLKKKPESIQHPLEGTFRGAGGEIRIIGADISSSEISPSGEFTIKLYFEVIKPTISKQKIFIHIEGYGGRVNRSGADHMPVMDMYATSQWKPGEIIVDVHTAKLKKTFPPGTAKIWMGFFEGKSRMDLDSPKADKVEKNRMLVAEINVKGSSRPPRTYQVLKTTKKIRIDGKLNEKIWSKASVGKLTLAKKPVAPQQPTEFMALWDSENIYFAFTSMDRDILSRFKERDEPLYREDAVEIFFDADGDMKEYHEIEVSPAGVLFDMFFGGVRTDRKPEWNPPIQAGVVLDGTLNKSTDVDKSWTVEMSVPLAEVAADMKVPPEVGDEWRVNVYRLNISKNEKREASAFSTTTGDFHQLHRFGAFRFVEKISPAGERPVIKAVPEKKAAPPRESVDKTVTTE